MLHSRGVLAIIPARGGSKRILKKNVALLRQTVSGLDDRSRIKV